MTTTSNHNWDIPDVGGSKDTWGQILNDLFDNDLDRQVTLEGTYADRPAAGSDTVKYYHATDRRIVYYNDGSSWEAIYGLGTDSNPVPGTSHFEAVSTESLQYTGGYTVEEDDNSPFSDSAVSSTTLNLSDSYFRFAVDVHFGAGDRNNASLRIQVNGETSGYNYYEHAGTQVTGESAIEGPVADERYYSPFRIEFFGRDFTGAQTDSVGFKLFQSGLESSVARYGDVPTGGNDISSITIKTDNGDQFKIEPARVVGVKI